MKKANKTHDVVVFGATSFVGQILARYLFETFGLDGDLRWAMAGRSRSKLETVRKALGRGAGRLDILTADAASLDDMRRLCQSTRVVVSTVGPYALYGEPLVQACAETGTDYCDLTGEVQWLRRMIVRHEATARGSGARIVHCCGFDSIPSDLGVHFLQREARRRFGQPCTEVKMRVRAMRGGFSGGTVASLLNVLAEVAADPALRKELADPYSLWTGPGKPTVRQHDVRFAEYDPDFGAWVAPFVMSAINTRVVHRSNMLARPAYGPEFRYDEAVLAGRGLRGRINATAIATALGASMVAGAIGPVRQALERFVLPGPGEGPSPEAQRRGCFDLRFH
ncbi:MAG TPA: saccharopine dehydrogenase NADP-binding domain-containing protein, partial [Steroidobacteraceae bacterium]|nr:saccharopine dehydrogenase NADP-binding domain-containing protein [Steroidobacteraceae bacterium]